jgi:hypothetical protein
MSLRIARCNTTSNRQQSKQVNKKQKLQEVGLPTTTPGLFSITLALRYFPVPKCAQGYNTGPVLDFLYPRVSNYRTIHTVQ